MLLPLGQAHPCQSVTLHASRLARLPLLKFKAWILLLNVIGLALKRAAGQVCSDVVVLVDSSTACKVTLCALDWEPCRRSRVPGIGSYI